MQNKIDLCQNIPPINQNNIFYIAANIKDDKLQKLIQFIEKAAADHAYISNDILLNERQFYKLNAIKQTLKQAATLILLNEGAELIAIELRAAGQMLDELTGKT